MNYSIEIVMMPLTFMNKEFFTTNLLLKLPCADNCPDKKCVQRFDKAICFRPIIDRITLVERIVNRKLIPDQTIKNEIVYSSKNKKIKVTIADGFSNIEHKSIITNKS
ncbi:MAG: hypothetical protein Q7T59_00585 [Candidatus Woesebacteria bacterium]|nr:hypothetical protein [Candidatus Woesebacteria bacterium]